MAISTARETLARMDKRIAEEPNPKYKKWMQVNRNHWWGEVIADIDMVMETMTHGPIRYRYDGHPFMKPNDRDMDAISDHDAVRRMYEAILTSTSRPAGPMDDERFMLDDRGLYVYGMLTGVYPGYFITNYHEPIDPNGVYLIRNPNLTRVEFDENDLMKGEEIINGAPIYLKQVDSSYIERLIDGPIVLP